MYKTCPFCGQSMPEEASFCLNCFKEYHTDNNRCAVTESLEFGNSVVQECSFSIHKKDSIVCKKKGAKSH